ncbi:MAG: efflux RND transporter periplasmic adaptor subunit [Bacteroidia bacterium]
MKIKKKYIYWGGLIILIVIFGIIKALQGPKAFDVTTEKSQNRLIIETVIANGKVQPEVQVKISSDVSGEIIELNVKEGDQVKKGDILAKINPDLYLSVRDRLSAALNTAKANVANAKARLSQSKAQFINAEAAFNRNKTLHQQGAISDAEFDTAKSQYEVAKADVEAAEQSVIAAEFNLKSAEASLKEANDNLQRTTIIAPVDGTVSMLSVEKGERVVGTTQMAGTELMRIANLTEMEVKVDVNENDIVRIKLGDTADVEIDAYLGRKFKGVVREIANSAKISGIAAEQVTNFEVKVRILRSSYEDLIIKDKPHLSPFRPGMTASVEIKTNKVHNALSVPIQAVTTREDTTKINSTEVNKDELNRENSFECVFVFEDGKAIMKKVTTGIQDSKYIQILSGINLGQEIITGPYTTVSKQLKDGDKVKIVKEIKDNIN